MTVDTVLLLLVTFSGPVVAVQVQKWIERARERRGRQLSIYETLMATRALRADSKEHVQALNLIDIFFNSKRQAEKKVRNAWAAYLDFLGQPLPSEQSDAAHASHNDRAIDLLVDLLEALGAALGHEFNRVQLKRGAYIPQAHVNERLAQTVIRDGLARIMAGQQNVKMDITSIAVSDEAVAMQKQVQEALLQVLSGLQPVRIQGTGLTES